MPNCRPFVRFLILAIILDTPFGLPAQNKKAKTEPVPIKALLVTGGCSHDYTTRKGIIVQGIRERVSRPIEWVVKHQGDGESDVRIPLFEGTEWAKGYDIVVHDHCFPRVRTGDYVDRILSPHLAGLPAVLIHGTMHSFRTGDSRWFDFCGANSTGHEREYPITVVPVPGDPMVKEMAPWSIPRGQLYRIDKLATGATALTQSTSESGEVHINTWTHRYGPAKTRVFSTTIGNDTSTLITPEYLDLLTRGFLWALNDLSDSTLVNVPNNQSLSGLNIAVPEAPLPELGFNSARLGNASALASGEGDARAPGLAIDGKPSTYWESDSAGPASWQVEFPQMTRVGAVALTWKEANPAGFLIERSSDGLSWRTLVDELESEGESTLVTLPFDPVDLKIIRVSIPSTPPGYVPGIREFAAYPGVDEIPSALIHALPGKPSGNRFRTVGKSGFERKLRLATGWSLTASAPWEDGIPVQFIPTASGKTFLLSESAPAHNGGDVQAAHSAPTEPAHHPQRKVHLLDRPSDGSITHSPFLEGLPAGTAVSWDGEWLYTFSKGILNAYRNLAGDGPANERFRVGTVLNLSKNLSFSEIRFSAMQLGTDGWFQVHFESPRPWTAYNARGEIVLLPESGVVRFRRNGEGFSLGEESGEKKDNEWDASQEIVQVEGLIPTSRDGGQLWLAAREKEGATIAYLQESSAVSDDQVHWDTISAPDLFDYLSSSRESVRREALPEILRRKRDPVSDLEKFLSDNPSPDLASGLLDSLTTVNPRRSLALLLKMSQSPDSSVRVVAFRHLAGHPRARNHPAYGQITSSTTPALTVEILKSILRSKTEIEGIDDLALSFTMHPDQELASESRKFLIARESVVTCFNALDDPELRTHWPGAFDVLCALKRITVVEGIVLRLERTHSAAFRRLGLEALCRLYYLDPVEKTRWDGTSLADLFIRASLSDHRVDRPALLNTMLSFGIPMPEADVLVDLATVNPALEALALETVVAGADPDSPEVREWVRTIALSPSRDSALRQRAGRGGEGIKGLDAGGQTGGRAGVLPIDELLRGIETVPSGLEPGRRLFKSLACGTCHNIHGEGPAFAPDLATAVETLHPRDLVESVVVPAKRVSPGYAIRLFELNSGQQLKGLVEGRDETKVSLRDRAGNQFTIPSREIRYEWPDSGTDMPCDIAAGLTLPEFASLIQFLKSLASGS